MERSTDQGEGVGGFSGAATEGGGDIGFLSYSEEADDQVAQCGHYLGSGTCSHLAAVLIHGHIPYPEHPVFDTPMAPPQFQQPSGISLLWWETGYGVSQLAAGSAFMVDDAFRPAHLGQVGPVACSRPILPMPRGAAPLLGPHDCLLAPPAAADPLPTGRQCPVSAWVGCPLLRRSSAPFCYDTLAYLPLGELRVSRHHSVFQVQTGQKLVDSLQFILLVRTACCPSTMPD